MATAATITQGLILTKGLTSGVAGVSVPNLKYDNFNTSKALTSSTTPAVSDGTKQSLVLSSGAKTIDLTALADVNGATITLNGLKARAIQFENPAANANNITFAVGASNGYNFMGSATGGFTLSPGQSMQVYCHTGAPTIGSGAKSIDVSGTAAQGFYFGIVAG